MITRELPAHQHAHHRPGRVDPDPPQPIYLCFSPRPLCDLSFWQHPPIPVLQAVLAEGSEPEGSVFLLPMVKKSQGEKGTWFCGQPAVRSG